MVKPTIHVDEFSSKMGEDDEIVVASFYLRDRQAAQDLVDWFEKGYDFVLDADLSPGEIRPNRYLVYVEIKRRSSTAAKLQEILDDFDTLTEYQGSDWIMHYDGQEYPFSVDTFQRMVPGSPAEYRKRQETDLNEMRQASGLPVKQIYRRERDLDWLRNCSGLL